MQKAATSKDKRPRMKDRVLVVAETLEAARLLRQRLYDAAKQPLPTDGPVPPLAIATKYFNAAVEVSIAERAALAALDGLERVDALVLCDPECPCSELDAVVGTLGDVPGVSMLCCEREARGLSESAEDELRAWCVDHETEFVDMGLQSTSERDKEGIDRVFEALCSHPWQCGSRPDPAAAAAEAAAKAAPRKEDDEDDEPIDRFCAALEEAKKRGEGVEDGAGGEEDDDVDEDVDDELFRLMSQLTMMRDKAQKMPEAQRKEYAAQVAMAYARLLAPDEDEEGSDEAPSAAKEKQKSKAAEDAFDEELQAIFGRMERDAAAAAAPHKSK